MYFINSLSESILLKQLAAVFCPRSVVRGLASKNETVAFIIRVFTGNKTSKYTEGDQSPVSPIDICCMCIADINFEYEVN